MIHWTTAPLVQCGKIMELSSDSVDSGYKKFKRDYGVAYGGDPGEVCVWRDSDFSRREDVLTFMSNLHNKDILYTQCDLQGWCCNKLY
jgi:hypothetical protein